MAVTQVRASQVFDGISYLDLLKGELRNARVQNLASAPASPVEGLLYHNTTTHQLFWYDGTQWVLATGATASYGSPTASAVGDASADGVATTVSRSDHKHAREAFAAVTAATSFGIAAANGTATTVARSDHTHGTPAAPTAAAVGAVANNGSAPGLQTGAAASKPAAGQTVGNIYADNDDGLLWIATGATTFAQLAKFAAPGSSAPGDAAAQGSSTNYARADHVHGREAFGAVTTQTAFAAASSNGAATSVARSDHTHGTPTHDSAAHSAISHSALAAPTADVPWGSHKITGLLDPTGAQDAATKAYVDAVGQGITSVKNPVRVATTANGALATAYANGQTVDGTVLATGDRILIKNQTTASENGIYTVNAGGAPTRATDADASGELALGTLVFVNVGTANGGQQWVVSAVGATPWVPGTSSSTWTMYFAATSVQAGSGLTATGNVFAVGAGTGITVAADTVSVDTAVVVRKAAFNVGDGAATSYVLNHNLGTRDVTVVVYTNSGIYDEVVCEVDHTDANNVTVLFNAAPTLNQYRAVVHG